MKEWRQETLAKVPSDLSKIGAHPILLALLYNRGFTTESSITNFLNHSLDKKLVKPFSKDDNSPFYDPFIFRDMEAAVSLIISHIKDRKSVV